MRSVVLTGAAGYVGATICHDLVQQGIHVIAVDNLSRGFFQRLPTHVDLLRNDVGDPMVVSYLRNLDEFDVIHCAAFRDARESLTSPQLYWENNVISLLKFLENLKSLNVRKFILSSSCSVYGDAGFVDDSSATEPTSTYGWTKLASERLVEAYAANFGWQVVSLRYFNVAGAGAFRGSRDFSSSSLFSRLYHAVKNDSEFRVFGSRLGTPDGSMVRDYVDVRDLSAAHLLSLDLVDEPTPKVLNVASGEPTSVLQVAREFERQSKKTIDLQLSNRNSADPISIWGAPSRSLIEAGWLPRFTLADMVESYLNAEEIDARTAL